MNAKLAKAILNNNELYEAVFSPQQIKSYKNDLIWYCLEETPPFYSNLVTVSENWRPDKIFEEIDRNFKKENWEKFSIKDSFSVLDLTKFGFKKLFDAQWIYLEAENFKPQKQSGKLNYKIVKNEIELKKWKIAWDADENIGNSIFYPQMLNDPKVFFVTGFDKDKIVSGCLINKTPDVLGISNFFAPVETIDYWSEMINFIFDSIKCTDVVGYERSNFARELQTLGFEDVGDLTVWLKESNL
jgi:hypothetical protein